MEELRQLLSYAGTLSLVLILDPLGTLSLQRGAILGETESGPKEPGHRSLVYL